MQFSLATLRIDGVPTPVLTVDDRHYRIADVAPEVLAPNPSAGLMTVFTQWAETEPVLLDAARAIGEDTSTHAPLPAPERLEDWLTPLRYPSKVICTGANYYDHVT
jgi:hypothetical protein